MPVSFQATLNQLQNWVRQVVQVVIVLAGMALTCASVAAAFAIIPWPVINMSFDGQAIANAGIWAQLTLNALLLALIFYLPANLRMARLERSHRSFAVGMEDIARAYPSRIPPTAPGSLPCRASLKPSARALTTCASILTWARWSRNCFTSQPR